MRAVTCGVEEVGDDFEGVALVDEELLALGGVVHLLRVLAHQRVEERVELVRPLAARLPLGTHPSAAQLEAFLCGYGTHPHKTCSLNQSASCLQMGSHGPSL